MIQGWQAKLDHNVVKHLVRKMVGVQLRTDGAGV